MKNLCALMAFVMVAFNAMSERNLLLNGGFEDGLNGWTTAHPWYEAKVDGKGTGISAWEIDERNARAGKQSAKVIGKGNRGIAMQVLRLPPATYRVRGWLKCENLGDANASILVEFLDKDRKWFQGITAGSVSGTTDWTRIEKDITFPPETVWVHFDLLTSAPNNGAAWFDEIELIPQPTGVPLLSAWVIQKPADAGEVRLKWKVTDSTGIAQYEIYVEPQPFTSLKGLHPKAVMDWTASEAAVRVRGKTSRVHVAVEPVSVDGQRPAEVKSMEVVVKDTKPPRAVEWTVRNSVWQRDSLFVEWQPCPLDEDIRSFHLHAAATPMEKVTRLGTLGKPFPAHQQMAWLPRSALPSGTKYLALTAVDAAGNESPPTWQLIPALTQDAGRKMPCDIWVTSPLLNIFRDTPKPANAANHIDLLCARNEAEGAQIVLTPRQPLTDVYVEVEPLRHENGKAQIAAENIAWHFVGYLHVEKNSTATPPEELLRKAPADFPDPFLEERSLDLTPPVSPPSQRENGGGNQPIFVRVFVPKDAAPGVYRGGVHVIASEGSVRVPLRVEVLPFALPDQLPLYVTNWFNVGNIARFHNVPEWSEDFWRTLRLYAKEMRRAHQNVVLTPLDLVKVWREEDGSLTFDYADFDRWVELFEKEGVVERIELSHLGGRTTGEWECKTFSLAPRPATDRRSGQVFHIEVEQFLPDLQRHLEERGWLPKTVLHIGDEPIPVNVASWREQSARAHRAAPKLKRIDAIHVPPSDVAGYLEVLVPQLNYFEQWLPQFKEAQARGSELWFYIAWLPQGKFTNRLIDLACIKTRLIHWINSLHGATGYLHWGLNFWTDFKDMGFAPGDNWIIYPGKRGPRSSLRWEAMRDGLEDFAYFHLLAQKSPERARELLRQVMRSATDYDKDPQKLEQVRREVAKALVYEDSEPRR